MMGKIPIFQVDAFTDKIFSGNPAAVCPITDGLPDCAMLSIAAENNLSETAFVDLANEPYTIRWFTPTTEVELCGHATLAAARILFDEYLPLQATKVRFSSKSGELSALKRGKKIFLDFPSDRPVELENNSSVTEALNAEPFSFYRGKDDFLVQFRSETEVQNLNPDFQKLGNLDCRGIIVTAPGSEMDIDFVSRFFAPKVGINEDPVTGSAHTLLTPYWVGILKKKKLSARQLSTRGGKLECVMVDDRVLIGGDSARYLDGFIYIP